MLVFITTTDHAYTIKRLLEYRRTALHGHLITMTYPEFLSWRALPAANYVFADLERVGPEERLQIRTRMELLRAQLPEAEFLNHPSHSLDRVSLLKRLYDQGINDFQVYSADSSLDGIRFPVFVRDRWDHAGSLSEVLESADDLDATLNRLAAAGHQRSDLIVVEFVDVRNEDGLYEKYGMFRIGDSLFTSEFCLHTEWVCKGSPGEYSNERWDAREIELLESNEHEALLRPVFEFADIQYGRADYAFSKGRLQVFEINTNPMIETPMKHLPDWTEQLEWFDRKYVTELSRFTESTATSYWVYPGGGTGPECVQGSNRIRIWVRRLLRRCRGLHFEADFFRIRQRLRRTH